MNLIKYNEAYAINDDTVQGWMVTGQAVKNTDGEIHINFTANIEDKLIGNYNYSINKDNSANVFYSYDMNARNEFVEYANNAITIILQKFGIE